MHISSVGTAFPPYRYTQARIFGLACVAGAAGIARASDYLRAFPDQIVLLLSIEPQAGRASATTATSPPPPS